MVSRLTVNQLFPVRIWMGEQQTSQYRIAEMAGDYKSVAFGCVGSNPRYPAKRLISNTTIGRLELVMI